MWKLAPFLILMTLAPQLHAEQCLEIFKYDEIQEASEQAVALFKEAVVYDSQKIKPADFRTQVTEKYQAALVFIEQVLAARPEDQKFLLMKTKSLTQTGQYEDALVTVDRLLELHPHFRPALLEKEDIFHRLGKTEEQKLVRLLINFIENFGEDFNPYVRP